MIFGSIWIRAASYYDVVLAFIQTAKQYIGLLHKFSITQLQRTN